jgi:phosphoglycerate kinase
VDQSVSKITVIENILDKVDHMIIGGGMTFTFVKALGGKIGDSICEDDKQNCLGNFKIGKRKGYKFIPVDVVAANAFSNDAETKIVNVDSIPDGWQGLDAGPKSLANFEK